MELRQGIEDGRSICHKRPACRRRWICCRLDCNTVGLRFALFAEGCPDAASRPVSFPAVTGPPKPHPLQLKKLYKATATSPQHQVMAWDSKSAQRRRQNSNPASRNLQQTAPVQVIVSKSAHTADPALQPFLAPTFDPADFLNATLPHLATGSVQHARSHEVSLTELSTQTQTVLSQLSAHTTRLTSTLTQLTDEILRSGSRLAYEVEVLRGETLGLSEALTEGLQDDIAKFVPQGLEGHLARRPSHSAERTGSRRRSSTATAPKTPVEEIQPDHDTEPAYIRQLRTLTSVRNRLDTVIKTFGDAMSWTFPPSEVSVSSAFLSVSAPEPGSEAHSIEEKGQQVSKELRNEIADLLVGGDPVDGIEAAAKRVEELKELTKVWKGTAEEKARVKFVESLAKMVEERHRELLREAEQDGKGPSRIGFRGDVPTSVDANSGGEGEASAGYGFISRLQKMRSGL